MRQTDSGWWGWPLAALLLAALYLHERNRREFLEVRLAEAEAEFVARDKEIGLLQGEVIRLRLNGIEDRQLIATLRQAIVERDELLRQLSAARDVVARD